MDKNNWPKEVLRFISLALQVYLESSTRLRNLENHIKSATKNLITLIIILIPILLTIWCSLFLSLFFYLTEKFALNHFITALIIATTNIILLIGGLTWFKHKIKQQTLEPLSLSLLLIKLMRFAKTLENHKAKTTK